jgi:hypothetical protein
MLGRREKIARHRQAAAATRAIHHRKSQAVQPFRHVEGETSKLGRTILFFLKADKGTGGNQILSTDQVFFSEQMLERSHTGCDFRKDEIDLLSEILQLLTEVGSGILRLGWGHHLLRYPAPGIELLHGRIPPRKGLRCGEAEGHFGTWHMFFRPTSDVPDAFRQPAFRPHIERSVCAPPSGNRALEVQRRSIDRPEKRPMRSVLAILRLPCRLLQIPRNESALHGIEDRAVKEEGISLAPLGVSRDFSAVDGEIAGPK